MEKESPFKSKCQRKSPTFWICCITTRNQSNKSWIQPTKSSAQDGILIVLVVSMPQKQLKPLQTCHLYASTIQQSHFKGAVITAQLTCFAKQVFNLNRTLGNCRLPTMTTKVAFGDAACVVNALEPALDSIWISHDNVASQMQFGMWCCNQEVTFCEI